MSTTVKEPQQKDFTPAPEGLHQAVCCDVWPIWTEKRPEQWGGGLRDMTLIVWQIDKLNPEDGRPFGVYKRYTASLHEKANLRRDLESWRGRKFTEEERKGFDLEKLIGVNCQIQVLHNEAKDGKTYANVVSIVPAALRAAKMAVSKDYIRKKDRKEEGQSQGHGSMEEDDDTVPFGFLLPALLPLVTLAGWFV